MVMLFVTPPQISWEDWWQAREIGTDAGLVEAGDGGEERENSKPYQALAWSQEATEIMLFLQAWHFLQ